MKRLRNLYPAPAWALPRLSREPQEKTWICPQCGMVPPIAFAEGWYARRPCACERAAWEAEQTRQLQAELVQARAALTYTWLGRAWAEPGLSARTFETFHGERQPIASATARAFAEQPQGTLALYGSYGTGKTHLLAAIANAVAARGQVCRFASTTLLFGAIQERIGQGEDYLDLFRRATAAPLLLLDDLDKLKPSEFREETLYTILNGRSVSGLPLAITSNNPPDKLAPWIGGAGCSRLMAGLIPVEMEGPDYRLEGQA
jgi:DNA replication protein DnaC